MEIEITKDIEITRDGRTKTLREGAILTVTKEKGREYLKTKCAKETGPKVRVIKTIKNDAELEQHLGGGNEEN
tara:strand:- start:4399 stop:4617 length:219 start_codon:yes stop_codon:yes gene_type:complete